MRKTISIIVPCYNEQESIPLFYAAVEKVAATLTNHQIEYWFVNDGSSDQSLAEMRALQTTDVDHVHYISFSRNFGKEAALYAGLQAATGDYVAVMDVDLQDPPALLPEMITGIEQDGFDCVGTRRTTRVGEPPIRSFFAKQFYRIINRISQTEIVDGARDYRLMTRQMVDAILEMSEYNRFSKGIFSWVGFDTKYLEYQNQDRVAGTTSWSFWGLFKYSLDGIVTFSETPLAIASFIGFFSFIIASLALIFIIIRALIFGDPTTGWPSLISVMLMVGGLQLLCLGIVGKYIGKIYLEVKNRPVYIVKEKK
ncbi:glycosyltransferase family 2 protein [Latilactobacillus fuchuensis]|uniref:Bactoprenol glucosyl transferase CPS-53 (KpLE1) prophage n=1 Tax=Latilactobacillus fuchuensis TaxID=164393 RepID=A0A2N9DX31_9LACO|nr:glycosyltransferase family 2 protein [Latilactobacillus fuchuensis]MCP8856778.1 glycosyltransferase family 2 protein [Latilactobacillus fuchuensis]SPC39233.1 bactoprenol glucosyl transferase; CPS-53 (KpLE1) prophage [Latilactobacillus fuchuensis]